MYVYKTYRVTSDALPWLLQLTVIRYASAKRTDTSGSETAADRSAVRAVPLYSGLSRRQLL